MKSTNVIMTVLVVVLCGISSTSFSKNIHVPNDYPTIQEAINAAWTGDVVLVDPGTYFENIQFINKFITVRSNEGPEKTIIDGSQKGSVALFDASNPTMTFGPNPILEGFTITNGTGTYDPEYDLYKGGGIFCLACSPKIKGNHICHNAVNGNGGGINSDTDSPTWIVDNFIFENTATGKGGGIFSLDSVQITNNKIFDNSSPRGGGIFCCEEPKITENLIYRNEADWGGGIHCHDTSYSPLIKDNLIFENTAGSGAGIACRIGSPNIINNNISGNNASGHGGGISLAAHSTANIKGCILSKNTAGTDGGGLSCFWFAAPIIKNCLIFKNSATLGGGMDCKSGEPLLINCTLAKNSASVEGGGFFCNSQSNTKIKNSILWHNSPDQFGGTPVFKYSNVQGGCSGKTNIDADPLFASLEEDDFHLLFGSPSKDAGNNNFVDPDDLDFEEDPRMATDNVDMGADEFYTHLYCLGKPSPGCIIKTKFIGPPLNEALLYLGEDMLPEPRHTKYGDWFLCSPITTCPLGIFPWTGLLEITTRIPPNCPMPFLVPLQGIVRGKLTNLYVLK